VASSRCRGPTSGCRAQPQHHSPFKGAATVTSMRSLAWVGSSAAVGDGSAAGSPDGAATGSGTGSAAAGSVAAGFASVFGCLALVLVLQPMAPAHLHHYCLLNRIVSARAP